MRNNLTIKRCQQTQRFHVKQVCRFSIARVLPLASFCSPSVAAVHKCTDASGKVVIGDHPCTPGLAAPKAVASEPAATANPVDLRHVQESGRDASLARIRAAQTPECLSLGDRIVSAANDNRAAAAADMGQVVAQYEKQCAVRAKAAIQSESNRREAEQKRQEKLVQKEAACSEKRRSLDERRAKFDRLSAQEKLAWARLLEEVGRECR
jgi:hypothetical protein